MANNEEFLYYPEYEDESFYQDIYRKKEFNRSKIDPEEFYNQTMDQLCSTSEKILQPHQEFLRNYLSDETPYNGIILFHGVGTGKCLLPGSRVYLNGTLVEIEKIWEQYRQDKVLFDGTGEWSSPANGARLIINAYDESTGKIIEYPIKRLYRQYINEPVRTIQLKSGQKIRLTLAHHLLTESGWSNDFINNGYVSLPNVLKNNGKTINPRDLYNEMNESILNETLISSRDIIYSKIASVYEQQYHGYVYDLEVEKHHNYIAEGVVCHNTCAAISIAEALKPRLQAHGKKVYIIAPGQTKPNFENEIYSFDLEDLEAQDGVEPGSYQCTGQTYYIPLKKTAGRKDIDVDKRRRQIRRAASGSKSVYQFFGHGSSFPRYVEQEIPKKQNKRPDNVFSNSVIIVDEAHNIISERFVEDREKAKSSKKAPSKIGEKQERGPAPVKNTLETLQDIFSGYHAFKADWVRKNRNVVKGLSDRDLELKTTSVWKGLSPQDQKKWLKYGAKNVKVILMTATPMENDPSELVELVNLLRLNDKKSLIDTKKMFKDLDKTNVSPQTQVNREYFCKMIKGYISYIRGQNPITFPEVLDPPDNMLYNPGYIDPTDPDGIQPIPYFKIDGTSRVDEVQIPLRLVYIPMSPLQYKTHKDWIQKEQTSIAYAQQTGTKKVRGAIQLGLNGRQLSNIIFPTTQSGVALVGNPGFDTVFRREQKKDEIVGLTKGGQQLKAPSVLQYRFNDKLGIDGLRAFIKKDQYSPNGADYGLLETYSPKFSKIIDNMQDPARWGINFCYSEFKKAGATILGIVLELNGFVRYTHKTSFQPSPLMGVWAGEQNEANPPLIYRTENYDPLVIPDSYNNIGGTNKLKRHYRCYQCTQLVDHPIHDLEGNHRDRHQFIQGVFVLFIGEGNESMRTKENNLVKQRDNRDGRIVKIVLGSKVSGEGVNFMNVRQVHILDPWHHNAKLYQAMGRAIRHCSHKDLPPEKRNVTIYKYSATSPNILGGGGNIPEHQRRVQQYTILQGALNDAAEGGINLNEAALPTSNDPLIKSITLKDLVTETTDEMVYFRVLKKDVLIKYVERLMKQTAIDCAFFKAANVFPQDRFTSERDGSRLCDYLPCNYSCIWNCGPPEQTWDPTKQYDINEDTYNLFFSKVQVDRVVRYLQKIFLKNWALTLEDIIELVHQRDPKIGIEYVYGALDKMLQDAPDRPILVDRYKRNGYLTFKGDYYVVQPFEVVRPTTPMYYRQIPSKVQSRQLNIERLKPSVPKVVQKKEELNMAAMDGLILKFLEDPNIIMIESYLDQLSRPELQYVFEKIAVKQGKDDPNNVVKIVMDYLGKRKLLLETANGAIGHIILEPKLFIFGDSGEITGFQHKNIQNKVVAANNFLIAQVAKEPPTVLFDRDTDLFDPPKNIELVGSDGPENVSITTYRFYGYYDEDDRVFKLVDLSTEDTRLTKDKKVSKKTHVTGKTCTTFLKNQLVYIAKVLSLNPDEKLLNAAERQILRNPKGTKADFCQRIEKALRILNERDKQNRWFLYPGEHRCIEYDPRHILNRGGTNKDPRTCKKTA